MSCFVVSPLHIAALVRAAQVLDIEAKTSTLAGAPYRRLRYATEKDLQQIGAELYHENLKAWHARDFRAGGDAAIKAHAEKDTELDTFTLPAFHYYEHLTPRQVTAARIIKAVHCYQYQAMDSATWEDSYSERLTNRILHAAIEYLPDYNAAPWGIREPFAHPLPPGAKTTSAPAPAPEPAQPTEPAYLRIYVNSGIIELDSNQPEKCPLVLVIDQDIDNYEPYELYTDSTGAPYHLEEYKPGEIAQSRPEQIAGIDLRPYEPNEPAQLGEESAAS